MVWFFESLYNKTGTKNKTKQNKEGTKKKEKVKIFRRRRRYIYIYIQYTIQKTLYYNINYLCLFSK